MGDWIEARVYRSLLSPDLMLGMPRRLAILHLTMTGAMVLGMGVYWFLLPAGALIIVFSQLTKSDPYFFDVILAILKTPESYE